MKLMTTLFAMLLLAAAMPARAGELRALGAAVIAQDQPAGGHGVGHRATAPPAAADQGHPDRVIFSGVNIRQD